MAYLCRCYIFFFRQYRTKIVRQMRSQIFFFFLQNRCRHTGVPQGRLCFDPNRRFGETLAYVKEILCKITENLQVYPKGTCVSIQIKDLVKHWRMTCKAFKRSLCGVAFIYCYPFCLSCLFTFFYRRRE